MNYKGIYPWNCGISTISQDCTEFADKTAVFHKIAVCTAEFCGFSYLRQWKFEFISLLHSNNIHGTALSHTTRTRTDTPLTVMWSVSRLVVLRAEWDNGKRELAQINRNCPPTPARIRRIFVVARHLRGSAITDVHWCPDGLYGGGLGSLMTYVICQRHDVTRARA